MLPVFSLSRLRCAYVPGRPVLEVPALDLPARRLVFVVGASGLGKSTLIETLGLMNRTIVPDPATRVRFSPDGAEEIELKDFWARPNADLSAMRSQHFSFIFQNTNLMPNFSVGENMMVSLLIKGFSRNEARTGVHAMMDRLGLPRAAFDKRVTDISGGQRQRLAFVRAATARFSVLFGDEPTGNLDRVTAAELLTLLSEIIRDEGKSALIVSHDLDLALRFAEIIVPIRRGPAPDAADGSPLGTVDQNGLLHRDGQTWRDDAGKTLDDPAGHLYRVLGE